MQLDIDVSPPIIHASWLILKPSATFENGGAINFLGTGWTLQGVGNFLLHTIDQIGCVFQKSP